MNFFIQYYSKNCRNDSNDIFYSPSKPYWSRLENSLRFERKFLQPFYKMWGTFLCNVINIVWLRFEKHCRKWPRNSQLWTVTIFFKNDSNENFNSHFTLCGGPLCAMILISYWWDLRNIAKIDQGSAECEIFQFCQRLSTRFERNFLQLSYTKWGPM